MVTAPELVALQEKFGTDAAIARHLGITRQSVFSARKQFGIGSVSKRIKSDRNNAIIQLHRSHFNPRRISEHLHMSLAHTYRILHKYGCMTKKEV